MSNEIPAEAEKLLTETQLRRVNCDCPKCRDVAPVLGELATTKLKLQAAEAEVRRLLELTEPFKLVCADILAAAIDEAVRRHVIDARSLIADCRLDYGEPFTQARVDELLTKYRGRSGAAKDHGEYDAVLKARAERDAALASMTQIGRERDEAQAELARLRDYASPPEFYGDFTADQRRMLDQLHMMYRMAVEAADEHKHKNRRLTTEVERLRAELAQAEAALLQQQQELAGCDDMHDKLAEAAALADSLKLQVVASRECSVHAVRNACVSLSADMTLRDAVEETRRAIEAEIREGVATQASGAMGYPFTWNTCPRHEWRDVESASDNEVMCVKCGVPGYFPAT